MTHVQIESSGERSCDSAHPISYLDRSAISQHFAMFRSAAIRPLATASRARSIPTARLADHPTFLPHLFNLSITGLSRPRDAEEMKSLFQLLWTSLQKKSRCSGKLVSCPYHYIYPLQFIPHSLLVQRFAVDVVGPKVREMDENERMDPSVIKSLFEQGVWYSGYNRIRTTLMNTVSS
jgi:hypothetical protein